MSDFFKSKWEGGFLRFHLYELEHFNRAFIVMARIDSYTIDFILVDAVNKDAQYPDLKLNER